MSCFCTQSLNTKKLLILIPLIFFCSSFCFADDIPTNLQMTREGARVNPVIETHMQSEEHWDRVYETKATESLSCFKEHASRSRHLIQSTGVALSAPIIDVGGGASTLVDDLLADGYSHLTVLDISSAALAAAMKRLGSGRSAKVQWLAANITEVKLPVDTFEVWHDRALFHFLASAQERQSYVQAVLRAVKPGGHVIVATFDEGGPVQCSGLTVVRYSAQGLHAEFGESFALVHHEHEAHTTPFGTVQQFVYCCFRKLVS